MKTLIQISLILLPFLGYSQAGTIVNYTDPLGALVLTYDGLVNGKHSYTTTVDNLTIAYSGTQWEITCCNGTLLHTSATPTAVNPPNLAIGNWVDLANNEISVLDGSGTTGILPVKLISFAGDPRNNHNLINWSTASETNNEGFELQRSIDGQDFQKVEWIKGQGNSTTSVDYAYSDKNIESNIEYFYRLKQIDLDGRYEYSPIIQLMNKDASKMIVNDIFPNPSSETIVNLKVTIGSSAPLDIQIYSTIGQLVMQTSRNLEEGSNHLTLDVNDLAVGNYFVKIESQESTTIKKLVRTN